MSFEKIENSVLATANDDASAIVACATKEGERELAAAGEQIAAEVDHAVDLAQNAADRETARQLSIARQEGRMAVLAAKNQLIESVLEEAEKRLRSLSKADYAAMVEQWMTNLSDDIGGVVTINPADKDVITGQLLDKVNASRPKAGLFTGIEVSEKVDRGFLIQGESFTADFTIPVLIEKVRESSIGDLARELFAS